MRKFTLISLFMVMTALAHATVYLDETFEYADGALKNNTGWISAGTQGSWTGDFMIQYPPLNYTVNNMTYVLSGKGKVMSCNYSLGSTSYLVYKNFSESLINTGNLYVSFLYTPGGEKQSQSQSPAMSLSASGNNTGVQLWVGKGLANSDNYRFGITRGSTASGDIRWAIEEYADLNAVYLIVLKYNFESQTSYLYVNPFLGSIIEPIHNAVALDGANPRTSIQNIQFKVNGSSKQAHQIGGVRVSTTWPEAVALKINSSIGDNINQESGIVYSIDKTIYLPEKGDVSVSDLSGRKLMQMHNTDVVKTDLPAGVYIVSYSKANADKLVKKIVIR